LTVWVGSRPQTLALGPLINRTCSYSQAIGAREAQAPEAAKRLSTAPAAQSWRCTFLGSPVDQRQQMVQHVHFMPGAQQYVHDGAAGKISLPGSSSLPRTSCGVDMLRTVGGTGRGAMRYGTDPAGKYYRLERVEMLPFLPVDAQRVLELGCAEGVFAATVKERTGAEVWGIECDPQAAERARAVIDRVLVGYADEQIAELPDTYFDAIVCNDILEHLVNPDATLTRLRPKLKPEGVVVASIPNIRYLPALSKVVFRKDFPQDDCGVFDRTHLRFYTRKSIVRLFDTAGFTMRRMKGIQAYYGPLGVLLTLLSLGYFADGFYQQYACVASPAA
jgi:hemophore-related protein